MAKAVINLQKESGGIVKISPVDGLGVTEVTVPESGNLVSVDTAVTDNAIARYDGTTGKVQNSGVIIDDNNNVGIGVAPSAWVDDKAIQLPQGSISSGYEYGLSSVSNAYRTSGNIWKYTVSQVASRYNMNNNGHQWQTAPSGTAGNAISWTNAMTLEVSGNLLVGTSTDNGVDKLQVNGNISYKTQSGRIAGTSLASTSIADTNLHILTVAGANRPLMLEIVNPNSGVTCIPIYPFGGSGVKFIWNILNPETGAFVNNMSAWHIILTITDRGNYPNTYTITLNGGNSNISIQATALRSGFDVYLTTM